MYTKTHTDMELINIVIQDAGNAPSVESYAVNEKDDIQKAEERFVLKAKELGFDDDDESVNELLEEAYWQNNNGDSVSLVWSNVELN